ncbi:MAG: AI-2E family transporter [Opitutae bacterium]|nr:AI-2E family transporter [Opitutae bacterium]
MSNPAKLSYVLVALLLLLVVLLHLPTLFITVIFSYFALHQLSFGRSKALGVSLFLLGVTLAAIGSYFFALQAYDAVPKIATKTIPSLLELARSHDIELPFSDYDSLKAQARDAVSEQIAGIGKYAKALTLGLVEFVIGLVVAVSLFVNARFQLEPDSHAVPDNIYLLVWQEVGERFKTFYRSFATVMGAQLAISTINTSLTATFILWNDFPYKVVIIVLTFLCGLLPIIGNLMSNTLIVGIAFTLSPKLALMALTFLVVLHKLEYFLNSKIIGSRIKNPMWLTLLGLIIGEALMGVPGMILAPVVLHYIKVEASRNKFPLSSNSP